MGGKKGCNSVDLCLSRTNAKYAEPRYVGQQKSFQAMAIGRLKAQSGGKYS